MTTALLDAPRARPLFDAERFLAPEPFVRPLLAADLDALQTLSPAPGAPAGWGRPGDAGVIALGPDGRPLGAAWYRRPPTDGAPEVTVAVRRDWRNPEVGGALLAALIRRARSEGHRRLALAGPPAGTMGALYRRYRFRESDNGHLTADLDTVGN